MSGAARRQLVAMRQQVYEQQRSRAVSSEQYRRWYKYDGTAALRPSDAMVLSSFAFVLLSWWR